MWHDDELNLRQEILPFNKYHLKTISREARRQCQELYTAIDPKYIAQPIGDVRLTEESNLHLRKIQPDRLYDISTIPAENRVLPKRMLLTNHEIRRLSGSEIDTLTIANWFLEKGYGVDIFTLRCDVPLSEMVSRQIRLISIIDEEELFDKYDLIWAHHAAILDYLVFKRKIQANKVLYISLSPYEPLERPPVYAKFLSLFCGISKVVIDALEKETSINREDIVLFPNYATNEFFVPVIEQKQKYQKICIVSNHIPQELIEFCSLAKTHFMEVDIYGLGYKEIFVDAVLLSKYDVVITIGRTVYYALALGKPVFCYDHFGGYGFITIENIERTFEQNFNGKNSGKKLAPLEIYEAIVDGPAIVNKDLEKLRIFAQEHFDFEKNMQKIYMLLDDCHSFDAEMVRTKFPLLQRGAADMMGYLKAILAEEKNLSQVLSERSKDYSLVTQENAKILQEKTVLEKENTTIRQEKAVLKKENKTLQEANQTLALQLNDILSSNSWKVTKPIRKALDIIKLKLRTFRT